MLSALDLTAAFSFDTATQQDGSHMIGTPMKMIITKLLRYMCVKGRTCSDFMFIVYLVFVFVQPLVSTFRYQVNRSTFRFNV